MSDSRDIRKRFAWRNRVIASIAAMLCVFAVAFAVFALPYLQGPANTVSPQLPSSGQLALSSGVSEESEDPQSVDELEIEDEADQNQPYDEERAAGYEPGVVMVQLAEGASVANLNDQLAQVDCVQPITVSEDDVALGYVELPLAEGVKVKDAASQLQGLQAVQDSQPNYLYVLQDDDSFGSENLIQSSPLLTEPLKTQDRDPNDPKTDDQWALTSIHAYEAWEKVKSNGHVTVAIIDAGCRIDHEDLKDNFVHSYVATGKLNQGIDDLSGHGTHVAGIVAARANNNTGVAGVSYNAGFVPIQVFTKTGTEEPKASTSSLVRAYQWLIDNQHYYNIRVVNMSLGVAAKDPQALNSQDEDRGLYMAVQRARSMGMLTVCSAGNDAGSSGQNGPYLNFPSDYLADIALTVIALQDGSNGGLPTRAYYSNYNMSGQKTKEISAPGSSILSTYRNSTTDYAYSNGTSMASPCVAGVAALLFAANPDLTPDQVENVLCNTTTDLGAPKWDEIYGAGEVNALAAVNGIGDFLDGDSSVLKGGSCTLTPSSSGSWTWSSNDSSVATVSSSGVVTGKKNGAAVITAKQGDKKVSRTITVYDISFSGGNQVEKGDNLVLTFNEKPNTGMWLIESTDESVATVSVDGTVTVKGVKVGKTKIRATLASNKSLVVEHEVTVIAPRTDFSQAKVSMSGWTYDGKPHEPTVTVKLNNKTLSSSQYSVSYSNNKDAGTCTATVTPKDTATYKNTAKGTCTVSKRYVLLTSGSASKTYDGKALTSPSVSVSGSGFVTGEVTRVWATGSITNAGSVSNAITYSTGVGFKSSNYNIVKNAGTLRVSAISMSSASLSSMGNLEYTGSAICPQPTVTLNGKTLVKGTDYTLSYSNNIGPGTATVTAKGKGNYTGSASRSFTITQTDAQKAHGVTYQTHVQNVGWQNWVTGSNTSGTSGKSLRLEGIRIKLSDMPYSGSIEYRTHIQNIGWQSWKSDGDMSGTSGRSLRLEAIQIRLTGEMANHYDVYYRVHAQNFGWMGWARNGAESGTSGYGYRLEAIQIVLVPKTGFAPGSTSDAYRSKSGGAQDGAPDMPYLVHYRTHVQNDGWQGYVRDGAMSGTSGRSLRLEGINISLGSSVSGGIRYRTHVQNIGWQDWRYDGAMSGTSGRALRLEGIQIELTGAAASNYDVWYRVHAQNFGWMGWAKNGEQAGTAGYAYRLEGIEIKLLPKGSSAPGTTVNAFRKR